MEGIGRGPSGPWKRPERVKRKEREPEDNPATAEKGQIRAGGFGPLAELERRRKPKTPEPESYLGKRKGKEREAETSRRGSEGRFHHISGMGSCPCRARRADGGGEGPQERKWMRVE